MASDWYAVVAEGKVRVLSLSVPMQVDSADFDKLHEQVLEQITAAPGSRWVIDLSAPAYMGSSVLGLLVNIRERIRQADGKLALCGLNARLQQVSALAAWNGCSSSAPADSRRSKSYCGEAS